MIPMRNALTVKVTRLQRENIVSELRRQLRTAPVTIFSKSGPPLFPNVLLSSSVSLSTWGLLRICSRRVNPLSRARLGCFDFDCGRNATSDVHISKKSDHNRIPILLADIGEGIAEVEIMNWMVKVGDIVQEFDPLVQVQSDKATVEITSRYGGRVVQLQANVGDMVKVGTPLAYVQVDNDSGPDEEQQLQPTEPVTDVRPTENNRVNMVESNMEVIDSDQLDEYPFEEGEQMESWLDNPSRSVAGTSSSSSSSDILATPAVRKLAKDHQLDLGQIIGSGPQGRVLKLDVLRYLDELDAHAIATIAAPGSDDHQLSSSTTTTTQVDDMNNVVVPLRGYHRLMVQTMTRALQIPHMVYSDEVNLNEMTEIRKRMRKQKKMTLNNNASSSLPMLVFAIKALSLALKEYPIVNSTLNATNGTTSPDPQLLPTSLTMHANHNIGVAMDTPRGLVVPVLHRCQDLSLNEITVELERLKQAARASQLTERELSGATITLSNIGAIGGTYTSPIITPPQVAILAMGRVQKLPRFANENDDDHDDQLEAVHILPISFGGDHRVLDGATLARFSNRWKYFMESPTAMLLHLK